MTNLNGGTLFNAEFGIRHRAAPYRKGQVLHSVFAAAGLCKAAETEIVNRVLVPLAAISSGEDLSADKKDKDIGRVAAYCADTTRKPPELGVFSHFLQTVIHSKQRRQESKLIRCFVKLVGQWTGSTWFLEANGLHSSLVDLTSKYRNKAAHIDELGKQDYLGCRELVIGNQGIVWKLILSTGNRK